MHGLPTPDHGGPTPGAPRGGNSPAVRMALLAFILSPLAVVVLLCVLIWLSLERGPLMNEPPRGAGAGQTGMYNQFGGLGRDRSEP